MDARRTPRRWAGGLRSGWVNVLLAVGLAVAGLLVAAPARAATVYRVDSVAACQRFLTAMGATIGTAERGHCTLASQGSEVHLPAGDSLVVARGWELFVQSVVFFNEGSITNYGKLRATSDVVNNVGGARFANHGKVVIQRGSSLNVLDTASFVNSRGGRVDAVALFDGATVLNEGTIRVGALTVADWYDAVLMNSGRIFITCGGSASGRVIGNQPIYQGHGHRGGPSQCPTPNG